MRSADQRRAPSSKRSRTETLSSGPKPLVPRKAGRSGATRRSSQSRQTANGGALRRPRNLSATRRRASHCPVASRRVVAGSVASTSAASISLPDASPIRGMSRLASIQATASPRSNLDPKTVEIAPQRGPEAGVVIIARYVEEQPLRRAEEVAVEHRDQLAG